MEIATGKRKLMKTNILSVVDMYLWMTADIYDIQFRHTENKLVSVV